MTDKDLRNQTITVGEAAKALSDYVLLPKCPVKFNAHEMSIEEREALMAEWGVTFDRWFADPEYRKQVAEKRRSYTPPQKG